MGAGRRRFHDPTRRALLAGFASLALARPGRAATAAESVEAILARSGLGARSGFLVADLASGSVLEEHRSDRAFPPASVIKIVTALYALDTLGRGYRFHTRVVAAGGDLALAGDGDPTLDTDALGALAAETARGWRGGGRLLTSSGALPAIEMIDTDQPPLATYNPTISGLNLNYNRALLSRAGKALRVTAKGDRREVPVSVPGVALTDRPEPRLTEGESGELWRIPAVKLAGRGGLCLPVRAPAPYAANAFAALLAAEGARPPTADGAAPARFDGVSVAEHASDPAVEMVRGMLFHSTNLTAETLGLRASQARGLAPRRLADSAGSMRDWARGALGLRDAAIANHSGLTDATRIAPADLIGVLIRAEGPLRDLLRERRIAASAADPEQSLAGARLLCKTGTLDFVSALAGYLTTGTRDLAFVIFAADPVLREQIPSARREDPPGAKAWAKRARGQEQALLRRWVSLYGG